MTLQRTNTLTFNELDDIFFNFFENQVTPLNGYEIKILDPQPTQILTEEEYNLSELKNYDSYRKMHADCYFSFFRSLFGLFDDLYIDYPLKSCIEELLKNNELEVLFPFLDESEVMLLFLGKDDFIVSKEGEGCLCKSIELLLVLLKVAMFEVFFPIFHFRKESAYLIIKSDSDLNYKMLFNESAKVLLSKLDIPKNLWIRD